MFTQAELERANRDMHARLLSVSKQILHELSRLERQTKGAPAGVRASVLAAADLIASTERRVWAETQHLPASALRRFEIMQNSLKAQEGVLRQLSINVERHAELRQLSTILEHHAPPERHVTMSVAPAALGPLPKASEVNAGAVAGISPWVQAPGTAGEAYAAPTPSHIGAFEGVQEDPAMPEVNFHAEAPMKTDDGRPRRRGGQRGRLVRARHASASRDGGPAVRASARVLLRMAHEQACSLIDGVGPRALSALALVVAGTFLTFGLLPDAGESRDMSAKPVAAASPSVSPDAAARGAPLGESAAPLQATPTPPPVPPAAPQVEQRTPTDTPPAPPFPSEPAASSAPSRPPFDLTGAADRSEAGASPATAPLLLSAVKTALPPASAGVPDADASKQKHAASKVDAEPTTPSNRNDRFVPVVFTHKDHATAMRALADLRQQYPKLLGHRQGEAQPVDLGSKGVWHRLVVLPPGPRPHATRLCDQFMAAGYDRCWVKAY